MRCYICAEEGGISEAVAVCSICGKALCMEHATREDAESRDKRCSLSGEEAGDVPRRILCRDCCAVLYGT